MVNGEQLHANMYHTVCCACTHTAAERAWCTFVFGLSFTSWNDIDLDIGQLYSHLNFTRLFVVTEGTVELFVEWHYGLSLGRRLALLLSPSHCWSICLQRNNIYLIVHSNNLNYHDHDSRGLYEGGG